MKVSEIKNYQKKINLEAKVLEKTPVRTVISRLDNVEHKVCEALIGDDTGTIYLTLWDNAIDSLELEKVYSFKNLFSSEFKKSLRVNLGRFGEFEKIDKNIEVNKDNRMSAPIDTNDNKQ